jgi:hypothetical protein
MSLTNSNKFSETFSPDTSDEELDIPPRGDSFVPIQSPARNQLPPRPGSAPPAIASPGKGAAKFQLPECLQGLTMDDSDRILIRKERHSGRGGARKK